jgi:hypothetical protein
MKKLKTIGLAVLAVAAITALAGAASAQATTTLCKKAEATCAAANQYAVGTVLKWATSGATATLTGPKAIGNFTCESSVTGHSTGSAATTTGALPGEVTALTWTNCVHNRGTAEEVKCSVSTVHLPYNSAITSSGSGNGNGTLTITAKSGNPGFTMNCPGVVECEYTTASASLAGTGGVAGTAQVVAEKVALTGSGGKCPVSTLDVVYKLSEPTTGVWVEN